jgi:hypothetical protein
MKTLAARLQYAGGSNADRMKAGKLWSLERALKNDYNSRLIKTPNKGARYGLINVNNLKPDYDKKILSIPFDAGLEAGDTFEVIDDHTHWMVYLPVLTETAYLRAEIIRCRYSINIDGEEYWVYWQAATETTAQWFMKNNVNFNELNMSGTIYIKNTPKTKAYFKRFTVIEMDGHNWQVEVTDSNTVPGIIELEIQEYFDNPIEKVPKIYNHDDDNNIIGENTVKQDSIVGYTIVAEKYEPKAQWSIVGNQRVKIQEVLEDGRICKVKIHQGAIGTFVIKYGTNIEKEITIDWAKPIIQGPQSVYPYDIHTYFLKNQKGTFSIEDAKLAKIIECGEDFCKVEIISGRKGKFELKCTLENGEETSLPISIGSL